MGRTFIFTILFLVVTSTAHAETVFHCFTFSNEVLFKAVDQSEDVAASLVVEACKEHPVTNPEECDQNLNCFEQEASL